MLELISKLGPVLNKAEQKTITAGVYHNYDHDQYDVEIHGDFPGDATCFCDGVEQPCRLHC
jgi:hypothetical protein